MTTYLCGGINGLSDADCRDWREVAKAQLFTATLDPMRRDYRGREDESVTEIVIGDLADINDCEIVLVNATKPSWGTAMELFYAASKGKTVIAWVKPGPVSPWLRYFSKEIHESLEDAIGSINQRTTGGPE
jgi:nucleoside 2-deoxyribosyltransferase